MALNRGGTLYFCGNGGSAADCQHIAAELVGRFKKERMALAAVALTTDTSILTAIANDYGYEYVFSRQLAATICPKDILFCLSTSGNSPNVLHAAEVARRNDATVVAMTGSPGGELWHRADYNLTVGSGDTARIQEAHIFLGHCLCDLIEGEMSC
jgi:D-sedoheptulose 7-phosphate isomerase